MTRIGTGFFLVLLAGCSGEDGDGGTSSGGAEGGPASGAGGASTAVGASGVGGSTSENWCNHQNRGGACQDEAPCFYSSGCLEGSCSCEGGSWTCTVTDSCAGAECPAASETRCGDACDSQANNCLCRCGGGPNFTACGCTAGSWDCGSACSQ